MTIPHSSQDGALLIRPSLSQDRAPAEASLADLLVQVAAGDHDAFEAAYPRLSRLAFGIALKVLRDQANAEEVAQDVLTQVWVSAARFDPHRGSPQAWVGVMAHRRAVDRVRARAATVRRETLWARPHPHTDPVPAEVEVRLEAQQVRCAMTLLTPMQRCSIELAYYQGLTYRQVADRLGVPLGTVKSRIRDGLIRLAAALAIVGE